MLALPGYCLLRHVAAPSRGCSKGVIIRQDHDNGSTTEDLLVDRRNLTKSGLRPVSRDLLCFGTDHGVCQYTPAAGQVQGAVTNDSASKRRADASRRGKRRAGASHRGHKNANRPIGYGHFL